MSSTEQFSEASNIELQVYDLLKTVIDPELGINIIDMGLVYKIAYEKESGILIEITLSSKGCPMGDIILDNVDNTIKSKFPDIKIDIKLVWEPSWTADFVTPEGRKQLGMTY